MIERNLSICDRYAKASFAHSQKRTPFAFLKVDCRQYFVVSIREPRSLFTTQTVLSPSLAVAEVLVLIRHGCNTFGVWLETSCPAVRQ